MCVCVYLYYLKRFLYSDKNKISSLCTDINVGTSLSTNPRNPLIVTCNGSRLSVGAPSMEPALRSIKERVRISIKRRLLAFWVEHFPKYAGN